MWQQCKIGEVPSETSKKQKRLKKWLEKTSKCKGDTIRKNLKTMKKCNSENSLSKKQRKHDYYERQQNRIQHLNLANNIMETSNPLFTEVDSKLIPKKIINPRIRTSGSSRETYSNTDLQAQNS